MNSKTGQIIKTGIILFLITAISAMLLAFVNQKTAPLIEKNQQIKETKALKAVMPNADDFEESDVSKCKETASKYGGEISKIYIAKNGSDTIGVCSIAVTSGYDKGIHTAVGVNRDGTVSGIEIISHNETPGLGANASKDDFKNQYKGKSAGLKTVKSNAADNEINAISGATMTSKGVTDGVNMAIEIAENILKEAK